MTNATDHITERDFQTTVVEMARVLGWSVHGVLEQRKYAKRLSKGFPDLVLARQAKAGWWGRVIYAELKSQKGRVSPEQQAWIDLLKACHQEVYLWRPSDMADIERVLK